MNHTERIARIRRTIIDIAAGPVGCHLGGSLSVVELLYAAYTKYGHDPDSRIILSKGHAAAALYATLYEFGKLTENPAETYGRKGSLFTGHPNHKLDCIPFSTGSLGHGVAYAAGWALARKLRGGNGVGLALTGDGELQEGLCWETFQLVQSKGLDQFVCLVDLNGCQNDGFVDTISPLRNLAQRFEAFGFALKFADGHNVEALLEALDHRGSPLAIIARTVKACGVRVLQGDPRSHYVRIPPQKAALWKKELDSYAVC